ncbi:MAG: fimbria/pilus outer membrane usher protein [Enterobacteriaceae bacterium]
MLASDDDMLPESLRGYAPVVRGIARTNAQVIIRQNGYEIYQTYVAPGAFEITDMYPTGGSGDLAVTIKGGRQRAEPDRTLRFAPCPAARRAAEYSMTSGVYRAYDNSIDETPSRRRRQLRLALGVNPVRRRPVWQ